jgi:hypothetical protein
MAVETVTRSKRYDMAEQIAFAVRARGLDQVYASGIHLPEYGVRNYYSVPICRARTLDGEVRVYGRTYITLRWNNNIPAVCHSLEEALALLGTL